MEREKPEIPNFEILRKIGEGGFGTVFLARKNGSYCALKTVVADDAKKELAGLEKYAAIADRQNLAEIRERGISGGLLYYAMPLADPIDAAFSPEDFRWRVKSLQSLIDEKLESPADAWFSADEILAYIAPLFDAAVAVGDAGLLHRDIKPDNALFFDGKIRLADFSLLRRDKRSLSNVGTPFYTAPSWFVGSGGNPDVYGLATTFYTLITGNLPDTIGRPAYRFPEKIADIISGKDRERWLHWHRCILRAIAENPAERFLTIVDFRNAVFSEDFSSSLIALGGGRVKRVKSGYFAALTAGIAVLAGVFFCVRHFYSAGVPPAQTSAFDVGERLFARISESGFSDEEVGAKIMSHNQWLERNRGIFNQLKEDYENAKKLSAKTEDEIVAEVRKRYAEYFDRLFPQSSAPAERDAQFRNFLNAKKESIDRDIDSVRKSVLRAKEESGGMLESMAIISERIENPAQYRQYVSEEYARYEKQKSFLKKSK